MCRVIIKDTLDARAIPLLGSDARQSRKVLAGQLNVSAVIIRRSIGKLIHSGILKFIAAIDSVEALCSTIVVLALDGEKDKLKSVTEILIRLPGIKWVATTGRFDILATAYLTSSRNLSEFLENHLGSIGGIQDSEKFVGLDLKQGYLIPVGNR